LGTDPRFRVTVVGERVKPMSCDIPVKPLPEKTFDQVPNPYLVLVPGDGLGTIRAMGNQAIRRGRLELPAGALGATSGSFQRVRRLGPALLILLLAAAVGGCGGSEEPGGAGGAPATTAAPLPTAATPTTSESPPPNDYYIRNVNSRLRTLPVRSDAPITVNVLAAQSSGSSTKDVSMTLDELARYFPNSGTAPFWITVEQGQVAKIAQQFLP
jgi:hypothetical protein